MAGMIKQVNSQNVTDPILRRIVSRVESAIRPNQKRLYDATVTAGMKLIWSESFDEEREGYLEHINGPQDVPKIVAHGIVKLIQIIQDESQQQEPIPVVGQAATVLMCQILEYVEAKKKIEMTKELVAESMKMLQHGLFGLYKITPELMKQLVEQRQQGGKSGTPAETSVQPQYFSESGPPKGRAA